MAETPRADDETNVTDIELMPDGRIFVFGTSLQVLDVLNELQTCRDGEISARLKSCQNASVPPNQSGKPPSAVSSTDLSTPSETTS